MSFYLFTSSSGVCTRRENRHFNHLYLWPRYAVVPEHAHKAFIPYHNLLSPSSVDPAATSNPTSDGTSDGNSNTTPNTTPNLSKEHLILHAEVTSIQSDYVEVHLHHGNLEPDVAEETEEALEKLTLSSNHGCGMVDCCALSPRPVLTKRKLKLPYYKLIYVRALFPCVTI